MAVIESHERALVHRDTLLRSSFVIFGLLLTLLTLGLGFRAEWATRLWMWSDVRMSYIFVASIAAAVAAPALWVGISGEFTAWAGVAINGVVVGVLATCYLMYRAIRYDGTDLVPAILFFAVVIVTSVFNFCWTHDLPANDRSVTPGFLRKAFWLYVAILLLVGLGLLVQVNHIFPWDLQPQSSTIFGCFFLGACTYFIYCLRRPLWVIAAGAVWAFLAYDIVLAVPYIRLIGSNSPKPMYGYGPNNSVNTGSLVIYLAVLGISAVVSLYVLFIDPSTRITWRNIELRKPES